jgi:hypothetical protein
MPTGRRERIVVRATSIRNAVATALRTTDVQQHQIADIRVTALDEEHDDWVAPEV